MKRRAFVLSQESAASTKASAFQNDGQARADAMLQGAEALPDMPAVQTRADDFENGYRRSLDLISVAGLALQLQSARAAIQAQPNAAAIQEKVGAIMTERWAFPSRIPGR